MFERLTISLKAPVTSWLAKLAETKAASEAVIGFNTNSVNGGSGGNDKTSSWRLKKNIVYIDYY